jgi:hypothetical protein
MRMQEEFLERLGLEPSVVTAGGALSPGGTRLQETFTPQRDKEKTVLHHARHSWTLIRTILGAQSVARLPAAVSRLAYAASRLRDPPGDTQFFLAADPQLRHLFTETAHALVKRPSGIANDASARNLVHAHELKRSGASLTTVPFPHTSFFDPFVRKVLLERTRDDRRQPGDVRDAADFLSQRTVLAVGQKVPLGLLSRLGSAGLDVVVTITPNHRIIDPALSSAHGRVFGEIATAAKAHPEMHWMLFPESGRTKFPAGEKPQIRIPQLIPALVKDDEWLSPEFYAGPYGRFNTDSADYSGVDVESNARLFVGEPFRLECDRSKRPTEFIRILRERMRAVGAPVDQFAWGYTKPDRSAPERTRQELIQNGQAVEFIEVV